ncbi:hypothetical protein PMAYCL1PPCAC_06428, partial [Pristionchus mayeri]
ASLRCRLYQLFRSTSSMKFLLAFMPVLQTIWTRLQMRLGSPSLPRELRETASRYLCRSMTNYPFTLSNQNSARKLFHNNYCT